MSCHATDITRPRIRTPYFFNRGRWQCFVGLPRFNGLRRYALSGAFRQATIRYGVQPPQDGGPTSAGCREGGSRKARDRGTGTRGRRPPGSGLERAPGQTHADAVLADDRLRAQSAALVLMGMLSSLPHNTGGRFSNPGSPPMVCEASSQRCHATPVDPTLHSPSSSVSLTKASLKYCTTNTTGAFSGNNCRPNNFYQGCRYRHSRSTGPYAGRSRHRPYRRERLLRREAPFGTGVLSVIGG
jgi:hypothetical protein